MEPVGFAGIDGDQAGGYSDPQRNANALDPANPWKRIKELEALFMRLERIYHAGLNGGDESEREKKIAALQQQLANEARVRAELAKENTHLRLRLQRVREAIG